MSAIEAAVRTAVAVSHGCDVGALCRWFRPGDQDRARLRLGEGWATRWLTFWRFSDTQVVRPVRDVASLPVAECQPVRRFAWRSGQRHRPGLQFLVCTGRHHGFESMAEQQLLLAVDFVGAVIGVVSQPFRLRFCATCGQLDHIPDFLVVGRAGTVVFDVRPAGRVRDEDRVRFAATGEVALACGWRYVVVTGWRRHVMSTLDTLSSQRRPLVDPLGLQAELLTAAAGGPVPFGELVAATSLPAVTRALRCI